MLCVRAEDALAAAAAVAMASDKMRSSVTLGGSIQRAMQRMGGGGGGGRRSAGSSCALPQRAPRLAAGSGDASASASCSGAAIFLLPGARISRILNAALFCAFRIGLSTPPASGTQAVCSLAC